MKLYLLDSTLPKSERESRALVSGGAFCLALISAIYGPFIVLIRSDVSGSSWLPRYFAISQVQFYLCTPIVVSAVFLMLGYGVGWIRPWDGTTPLFRAAPPIPRLQIPKVLVAPLAIAMTVGTMLLTIYLCLSSPRVMATTFFAMEIGAFIFGIAIWLVPWTMNKG